MVRMPICPVCKYEYTDGSTECVDCGVTLVDELSDEPECELEGVKMSPFRSYTDRLHAEVIKEALANEGIPAIIKTDDAYSYSSFGPGDNEVMLWVAEDSVDLAEEIADRIPDPEEAAE
jgi:hypothetical protein